MAKQPATVSIINAKGGVGKTTTAVNLGAGLALRGYRVLLIDIDLQANLTHSLIGDLQPGARNIAEALIEETSFDGLIRSTETENLFIVPAGESLTGIDLDLTGKTAREQTLARCIRETKSIDEFDLIIIDNPPYFSLATLNSLVASTHYLVPVSCEYLPMIGVRLLEEKIDEVKKKLNPDLSLLGILLTMYDRRVKITSDVEGVIRDEFGKTVLNTHVRINTHYQSIPVWQQTIFQFEKDANGKGSLDYDAVTEEVIERLQAQGHLRKLQHLRAVENA